MEKAITFRYHEYNALDEMSVHDRDLVKSAIGAMQNAYAPYSNFKVGAAIRFDDGTVTCGSNQENIAYPSGLCAERTAMFYAQAAYPEKTIDAIAIASASGDTLNDSPVYPCGACRQVLLESELRNAKPIRVICYGGKRTVEVPSASSLLPLQFEME